MSTIDSEFERRLEEDRRKIKELQAERAREAAAKEAAERAARQRRAQEALRLLEGEAERASAQAAKAKAEAEAKAKAAARPSLPAEYAVQPGDTLSAIALKFYGNAALWREIFKANKRVIGDDPGKIFVGQKLRIPKLD